jgi:hypothetical protein
LEYRICKVCLSNKELTIQNFSQGKNRRSAVEHLYWYKTCKICDRARVLAKSQRYKEKNRRKLADKQIEYHKLNKGRDSKTKKQWYQKNKDAVKTRVKKNIFARRKNPLFRLKESISSNIRACIKKNRQPFSKFLPYTIIELRTHLEKQFESWMTWKNFGVYRADIWDDNDSATWTWRIDHIVPHSKFNYSSMEDQEFRDCWSLSNLRPYSAKQNLIDGDRDVINK